MSEKFQAVIPKEVRESLTSKPGQKLEVIVHRGACRVHPDTRHQADAGFLRGIDTSVQRDEDRV